MSDYISTAADPHRRGSAADPAHPAAGLRFVLVEYTDGPDRCTVRPPDPTAVTTTWLTADRDDFVDLSTCR
jgi:hypothetical protein